VRCHFFTCTRFTYSYFFFSSRRRHTRWPRDWSSDVCSSDLFSWQLPHRQENQFTLGTPATARRAIAVGNHNTVAPTPDLDQFSGRGPSRDGRIEPEIAAVGIMTAPRSRDMNAAVPGAFYAAGSGTSRAAPLVAGACALLLECRGATATWANLKQILEDTADTTGLVIPSLGFGFGSLRVANACAG